MVKIFFYELRIEFMSSSHLANQTFFKLVESDVDADFLFVSITNQQPFFKRVSEDISIVNKKVVLYNLTEPISFGGAKGFYENCLRFKFDSKNIFFHSTNHFLDKFNCLHKGLGITDHSIKSQLYTGFVDIDERFLKFYFTNNAIRKPRALVLDELLGRNLNFNQCYVSCNGEFHVGTKHIENYPNIQKNIEVLQSHDHLDVYHYTSFLSDKNFQPVYKHSFFGFTIETFSDFNMDNGGFNCHLTEKTIRNFAHKIPFLYLTSSEDQIKIIEDLGFVLFNDLFDFKINLEDIDSTIKKYVDVIEMFSKMKSSEVKKLCTSNEFKQRIEQNYIQYLYYKDLNIENIYKYILSESFEDRNIYLDNTIEKEDFSIKSIISNQI